MEPPFMVKVVLPDTYTPPPWPLEVRDLLMVPPFMVKVPLPTYTAPPLPLVVQAEIEPPFMMKVPPLTHTPPPLGVLLE